MRTPLAVIVTVTGLAALAPAHAMAVADNPSAGECRTPRAGDTVVLIGGQLCAANQGSGGSTGTGALPGGRTQPGEVVWVTGDTPECLRNSASCLPGQVGGRGRGQNLDGDGPGWGGPRGGTGSKSPGRSETAKGKPPTKEDCKAMEEDNVLAPSVLEELADLDRQFDMVKNEQEKVRRLNWKVRTLEWKRPTVFHWTEYLDGFVDQLEKYWEYEVRISEERKVLDLRQAALDALKAKQPTLEAERRRVLVEGTPKTNNVLRQCGALYGY